MALLNEKDQHEEEDNKTLKDSEDMDYETADNFSTPSNLPMDAPPSYEEVVKNPEVIEEKKFLKPKERPSVDAMMFGKQQDVTGKPRCVVHI